MRFTPATSPCNLGAQFAATAHAARAFRIGRTSSAHTNRAEYVVLTFRLCCPFGSFSVARLCNQHRSLPCSALRPTCALSTPWTLSLSESPPFPPSRRLSPCPRSDSLLPSASQRPSPRRRAVEVLQLLKAMRGELLPGAHVLGFLRRVCKLLFLRVRPLIVLDCATPALKHRTVLARLRQRENAQIYLRWTAEKLLLNQVRVARGEKGVADDGQFSPPPSPVFRTCFYPPSVSYIPSLSPVLSSHS
ncbi:unnamed protein product [Closterium sp. Naga37s-1]|nr:unnamed protein product [Closterium sp. Naga37s-1]